jgi:dienelactone hydrolase
MLRGISLLMIAVLSPAPCLAQAAVAFPTSQIRGHTDKAILSAGLHKPDGDGPFPAVIVLHDCGGVEEHAIKWARLLVSWGYVAIVPDSFGSRGHGNMCTNVNTVDAAQRVQDAIGTAEYLATLPYVRRGHIGVVGFSHGGWTIMKGVQDVGRWSSYGIKAAVAVYPLCHPQDTRPTVPLLILIGEKDDWMSASFCQTAVDSAENKSMMTIKVYPGAFHAYDREIPTVWVPGGQGGGGVVPRRLEYDAAAAKDTEVQARSFFDARLR